MRTRSLMRVMLHGLAWAPGGPHLALLAPAGGRIVGLTTIRCIGELWLNVAVIT